MVPKLKSLAAIAGLALLAACKTAEPPPPPPTIATLPPPPLNPQVIPYRPIPPGGASPSIAIPAMGVDGVRQTVNAYLDPLEAVWNFRSGWNVAALNCLDARYEPILDGYRQFLDSNASRLTTVNRELDQQYRREHGSSATREREAYMTQVYNYFAMPNAQQYFCDAALAISLEALYSPPEDVDSFALTGLPRLEAAFEQFFTDFEQYQVDVAVWDAQYGPLFAPRETRQQSDVLYAEAITEDFEESNGRVMLNAPANAAQAVSEPVIQPLPGDGGS